MLCLLDQAVRSDLHVGMVLPGGSTVLHNNMADQPATLRRSPATESSLLGDVTRCQEAIQQTLMALQAGSTRREVERRGVLGELLDHLATMARLLGADGLVANDLEQRVCGYLERVEHLLPADTKASLDRETARELPTELRCMLLEVAASTGHLDYLETRLEEEQRREQLEVPMLRWSDLLDPDELAVLPDTLARPDANTRQEGSGRITRRAVEMLATLYQARNHADREQRAHERVRDARLQWVTRWLLQLLMLAAALLVFAFALPIAGTVRYIGWLDDAVRVFLVIIVGGLGGALSGTRRLLGVPLLRGQLDRFQAAFRGQVVVGGTLGLVALLLFEVGSLPTFQVTGGVPSIVPVAIYAFLAGFSEPFTLGVVQGLIGGRSTPSLSGQSGSSDPDR
jgi:hypothetical protein